MSNEKKRPYFPLYWLFNRDQCIYIMVYEVIPNITGQYHHLYIPKQPGTLFSYLTCIQWVPIFPNRMCFRAAPQWGQPPIPWWLPASGRCGILVSHPDFHFHVVLFFWLRITGWYAGSSRWRNLLSCAKWSHHVQLFKKTTQNEIIWTKCQRDFFHESERFCWVGQIEDFVQETELIRAKRLKSQTLNSKPTFWGKKMYLICHY